MKKPMTVAVFLLHGVFCRFRPPSVHVDFCAAFFAVKCTKPPTLHCLGKFTPHLRLVYLY